MIRSYTNNELIKLMDMAPLPVQRAIESKGTVAIVTGLGTRLGLHIDQIGKIAALNVQMLLGLVSPEEFLKELIAAKVPEKDAREIMTEINQKIFMPLRDEMRKETEVAPEQPRTFFHLENKIPLPRQNHPTEEKPPQILIPAAPVSPKPALRDVLASVMKAPSDDNHSSPEPRQLLEDHEEPHIEFRNKARAAAPLAQPAPPKPLTSYSTDPYREPIDEK